MDNQGAMSMAGNPHALRFGVQSAISYWWDDESCAREMLSLKAAHH